ncbi:MAG: FkbM family methyltransferase [Blastocatellia bacterium]
MVNTELQPASVWIRLAATMIHRLPVARYRAMSALSSHFKYPFLMQLSAQLGGYWFKCDLRDSIAREICFNSRYEPQETSLIESILRPGMTFADVGANWGYFTLIAAHLVGKAGRIISLEPDPRLFQTLQDNVSRNDLSQVTALQLAAADKPGTLALNGYDENGGNWGVSSLIADAVESAAIFPATARPLDALLDEQGIDRVDLLKMDIEGAEEMALRGMSEGLAKHRYRRILLEAHPALLRAQKRTTKDVLDLLIAAGYQGWIIDHSSQAIRRAAYARALDPADYLKRMDSTDCFDEWPHFLWLAPDSLLQK